MLSSLEPLSSRAHLLIFKCCLILVASTRNQCYPRKSHPCLKKYVQNPKKCSFELYNRVPWLKRMFITGSTAAGISSNHISLFSESLASLLFRLEATIFWRLVKTASLLDKTRCSTKYECPTNPTFNLRDCFPFLYLFHWCKFHNTFGSSLSVSFGAYERHLQVRRYFTGKSNEAVVSSADIRAFAAVTQGYTPRTSTSPSRPSRQHYVQQF